MTVTFVVMIGVMTQLRLGGDREWSQGSPPSSPKDFEVEFALAEELHTRFGALDPESDSVVREDLRIRALAEYTIAANDTDSLRSARALVGAGQLTIAGGDTAEAIALWERVVGAGADSFQALRAMKSIAAALYDSNSDRDSAIIWYCRIAKDYAAGDQTQPVRIIVDAARKRCQALTSLH